MPIGQASRDCYAEISPLWSAKATAWTRVAAPSFDIAFRTCVRTVSEERN
jgi:hypothetical protein